MQIESIFNCYYFSIENGLLKVCCNTLTQKLTTVIFVTVGRVALCTDFSVHLFFKENSHRTSVLLGSDILVLLVIGGGSVIFFTALCDIKILKFNEKPTQICYYCKYFENESIR